MSDTTLYSDHLVDITEKSIVFKTYYYPFGGKQIPFSDIDSIIAKKPTLLNGRFRIYGSSDLITWFPNDWHRPSRPEIFFAKLRHSWRRVGFTVEDSNQVEQILHHHGLLLRSA